MCWWLGVVAIALLLDVNCQCGGFFGYCVRVAGLIASVGVLMWVLVVGLVSYCGFVLM